MAVGVAEAVAVGVAEAVAAGVAEAVAAGVAVGDGVCIPPSTSLVIIGK